MLSVAQLGSTRSLERPACFAPGVCVCVCVCVCVHVCFYVQWPLTQRYPDVMTEQPCVCMYVCVLLVCVAITNCNVNYLTLNFTQHDDWTTAKTFLSIFLLIPQQISLHFSPLSLSDDLSPLLLFTHFLTTCPPSSIPAIQYFYWHESQMNSINKASKYKKKLTTEIINKQIKHKPFDFPSVSFFCLLISIVFYLFSYHLSLFFLLFFLSILINLHIVTKV